MRAACIANIIQGGRKTFLLSVRVYNHQETNKARKLHKVDEKKTYYFDDIGIIQGKTSNDMIVNGIAKQ